MSRERYMRERLAEVEAVGDERDLAGLPVPTLDPYRPIQLGWVVFMLPNGKVTGDPDNSGIMVGEALADEHVGTVLVCTEGPATNPVSTHLFKVDR